MTEQRVAILWHLDNTTALARQICKLHFVEYLCSAELLLCVRDTDGHLALHRPHIPLRVVVFALRLRSRAMLVREGFDAHVRLRFRSWLEREGFVAWMPAD